MIGAQSQILGLLHFSPPSDTPWSLTSVLIALKSIQHILGKLYFDDQNQKANVKLEPPGRKLIKVGGSIILEPGKQQVTGYVASVAMDMAKEKMGLQPYVYYFIQYHPFPGIQGKNKTLMGKYLGEGGRFRMWLEVKIVNENCNNIVKDKNSSSPVYQIICRVGAVRYRF